MNISLTYLSGTWVRTQRYQFTKGILATDRYLKLSNIDFIWDVIESEWNKNFNDLIEFIKVNGHCKVSSKDLTNKKLRVWINTQRSNYRKNKLNEDRIKKLEEIGFEWDVK